jgi:chaperonin cofactor prefoldin
MQKQSYYDALTLINSLLSELKRLDDVQTGLQVRRRVDGGGRRPCCRQSSTCLGLVAQSVVHTRLKQLYFRQALQARLVAIYMQKQSYYDALTLINSLLSELKRCMSRPACRFGGV